MIKNDTVTQVGRGGQQLQWIVEWYPVSAQGENILATTHGDTYLAGGGEMAVQSVVLPAQDDGSTLSYGFAYGGVFAELVFMGLPTGSEVSYSYAGYGDGAIYGNLFNLLYLNPLTSKTLTWQDQDSPGTPTRTETTTYQFTSANANIFNPDGGERQYSFYDLSSTSASQNAGLVNQILQPDGSKVQHLAAQLPPAEHDRRASGRWVSALQPIRRD